MTHYNRKLASALARPASHIICPCLLAANCIYANQGSVAKRRCPVFFPAMQAELDQQQPPDYQAPLA